MILAFLKESELILSDEMIEVIIHKVHILQDDIFTD